MRLIFTFSRAVLTNLNLNLNDLTEEAALGIVRVERQRNKLTSLGLAGCGISSVRPLASPLSFVASARRGGSRVPRLPAVVRGANLNDRPEAF